MIKNLGLDIMRDLDIEQKEKIEHVFSTGKTRVTLDYTEGYPVYKVFSSDNKLLFGGAIQHFAEDHTVIYILFDEKEKVIAQDTFFTISNPLPNFKESIVCSIIGKISSLYYDTSKTASKQKVTTFKEKTSAVVSRLKKRINSNLRQNTKV